MLFYQSRRCPLLCPVAAHILKVAKNVRALLVVKAGGDRTRGDSVRITLLGDFGAGPLDLVG